jgi:hypothetical protein
MAARERVTIVRQPGGWPQRLTCHGRESVDLPVQGLSGRRTVRRTMSPHCASEPPPARGRRYATMSRRVWVLICKAAPPTAINHMNHTVKLDIAKPVEQAVTGLPNSLKPT